MIARLTPRAWAAIGTIVLISALLAALGLDALGDARLRLATLEMQARSGAAPSRAMLAAGLSHGEADRPAAVGALAATARRVAADHRLLVERIDPLPLDMAKPAELAVAVSISGPEADILQAARMIEGGRPAARFAAWRIARTGRAETAVRLEGTLIAYWEPRR